VREPHESIKMGNLKLKRVVHRTPSRNDRSILRYLKGGPIRQFFLGLGVCLIVLLAWTFSSAARMVRIRDALFIQWVDDSSFANWYNSSASFPGKGIPADPADAVASTFRSARIQRLLTTHPFESGTFEDSLASMAKLLGPLGGSCGEIDELGTKLEVMLSGTAYGCCSDYSEAFLALAEHFGFVAREVINSRHSFDEVFDATQNRWILFDPMLITLVRDSNGEPLNALSVRNIERHGGRVTLQFQKPGMLRYGPIRYWDSLYSSDAFAALRITLGSDVIGQSAAHQKVAGLPKPLAHLIEHLSGTRPGYRGVR